MWLADVRKESDDFAQLYSSWEGSGSMAVVCLLDPPRMALPPSSYHEAQQNLGNIFRRILPSTSVVVGLQHEFMQEILAAQSSPADKRRADGELGIVQALSQTNPRPVVLGLESADCVEDYKRLESKSVNFMANAASFLQRVAQAYGEGRKKLSPKLLGFLDLVALYREGNSVGLNSYIDQLLRIARSLPIDLATERYMPLLLFESMCRLESEVAKSKCQKTNELVGPLVEKMRRHSQPETIDRRAVWQLHRYQLQATGKDDQEAEIEAIERDLQQETLPEPSASMIRKACELVQQRCLVDLMLVLPGEDKSDLLGPQGASIANLLEMAAVLGISAHAFPSISLYMNYLYFYERLKITAHEAVAHSLSVAIGQLEKEIGQVLGKEEDDRALMRMDPAIRFIEALGRYHILHGEEWKRVVIGFSLSEVCATLAGLGIAVLPGWEARAAELDREFAAVRDFFDLSVVRGKDMASAICSAMESRKLVRGVLYCDSFQYDNLARWFQSHNVSYAFLFPRFRVEKGWA